jgi:cytochrome c biogenesis protein
MAETEKGIPAAVNQIWAFFSSIRLTVVILLTLAATSIVGTLVPQNENPAEYFRTFGAFLYQLFMVLDIFDMYHSWWFQLLLILLATNVIICSLHRISTTWKIVFVKPPPFQIGRFKKLPEKVEFVDDRSLRELREKYEPVISHHFRYSRVEGTEKGFCIFAEKGRWTRLGVYTVHLSVVMLLIGALIGSILGFDGFVTIPEGEAIHQVRLRKSNAVYPLDFSIRCDDFNVTFYESGTPKEYRSTLTILEENKPVLQRDIIVNDPLRYKGINLFQSSYGSLPPNEITLKLVSQETGMQYEKNVTINQPIELPEGMGQFVYKNFKNSFSFRGQNLGGTVVGIVAPKNSKPTELFLPLRFPDFDKMRKGPISISIADYHQRYYTGLQVTKDPGVWVVYSGFMLMILGFLITFFMSHKRLCIEVVKKGEKSGIMVAGTANKNKIGMQIFVKNTARNLAELE